VVLQGNTVTAAGVQHDATIFNDTERDRSWDAVWQSAVTVDESGWSVEMRIPFSQLRFPSADRLTFGINAIRYIQRKKEEAWLVHIPKTESGLASRMAHLEGLDGVAPRRTVEFLPYAASRVQFIERSSPGDPFNDGARVCESDQAVSLFANLGWRLTRADPNQGVDTYEEPYQANRRVPQRLGAGDRDCGRTGYSPGAAGSRTHE
jgi:hypothetical protein